MQRYIFTNNSIDNNYRIIFLCGSKFTRDKSDKRRILQEFLQQDSKNQVLILEKHFDFVERNNKLSYDKIFLKDLLDVETLTALIADAIIIIHESISTAAEFGIFAANRDIQNKICLLVPDKYNIEENKLSKFLELSFFRRNQNISVIRFYPVVKSVKISEEHINLYTYFQNNKITKVLGENINEFINKCIPNETLININKNTYINNNSYSSSYTLKNKEKKIIFNINCSELKYMIYAIFNISSFRGRIKGAETLVESVTIVQKQLIEVLKDTVIEREGLTEDYAIECSIINFYSKDIELRTAIAFNLYILQALGVIKLPSDKENGKKFVIHMGAESHYSKFKDLICEVKSLFN